MPTPAADWSELASERVQECLPRDRPGSAIACVSHGSRLRIAVVCEELCAHGVARHRVASIATGAGEVIGSVVGAFFGVKSGSRNNDNALKAQRAESARVQIFAAKADPSTADDLIAGTGLEEASQAG